MRHHVRSVAISIAVVFFLTATTAFADEADAFKLIFEGVDKGDWKIAAAGALMVLVWLLRGKLLTKVSPERLIKLGKLGSFIGWLTTTDLGGALITALVSVVGAIANALAAGQPITSHLVLSALQVAAIGSGLYSWVIKPIKKAREAKEAHDSDVNGAPPDDVAGPITLGGGGQ